MKIINILHSKRTGAFTCPHCGNNVKAYNARTLIKTPYGTIAFCGDCAFVRTVEQYRKDREAYFQKKNQADKTRGIWQRIVARISGGVNE